MVLAIFIILVTLPRVTGTTHDPYKAMAHVFAGGMVGAAWGRGVHASLKWEDYAFGAVCMLLLGHLVPLLIN